MISEHTGKIMIKSESLTAQLDFLSVGSAMAASDVR